MSELQVQDIGTQEVMGVSRIEGPILVVEGTGSVGFDDVVEVIDSQGQMRHGRVLEVGEGMAVVEVFAGTTGLSIDGTRVRFLGCPSASRWRRRCWGVSSTAWAGPWTAALSR